MGKYSRSTVMSLVAAVGALALAGCLRNQLRRSEEPGTRSRGEVLDAAASVLKERYYQVKVFDPRSSHIVALTPVELNGNHPVRKKIDVRVFQENGYYMPQVSVRTYIDTAEPPAEKGGPIAKRFPIEVSDHPVAEEDWQPLVYDRNLEQELRRAILERLNLPKA